MVPSIPVVPAKRFIRLRKLINAFLHVTHRLCFPMIRWLIYCAGQDVCFNNGARDTVDYVLVELRIE
jgi:hypothetical protein